MDVTETQDRQPSATSWATVRTPEDLGQFLARRRAATGWTQRDLAEHLGFPPRYLHEIESGKQTLAYTRLFALLRALGVETRLEANDVAAPPVSSGESKVHGREDAETAKAVRDVVADSLVEPFSPVVRR